MSSLHPSEALLATFELDRVRCELVPSASVNSTNQLPVGAAVALAVGLPLVVGLALSLIELRFGLIMGGVTASLSWMIPLFSYLGRRRTLIDLTPQALEIRWRVGDWHAGEQTFPLTSIRAVYAVQPTGQGTQMLRVVSRDAEVWLPAGGVPSESLAWLAEEVMRAATAARDRDAAGPPVELEDLLSESTRAARDRYLRHEKARKQRA